MKRLRFRCKKCKVRSWFIPSYKFEVDSRGFVLRLVKFKCPKCFCSGVYRFRRTKNEKR